MAVEQAKPVPACPMCNRTLEMRMEQKANGYVSMALVCSKHGAFPRGWKTKFFEFAREVKRGSRRPS